MGVCSRYFERASKCDEWQEHYAGTITKVNGDGTYGVTFEDGDSRRFMQTSQLKLPDGPTSVDTRADTGVAGVPMVAAVAMVAVEVAPRLASSVLAVCSATLNRGHAAAHSRCHAPSQPRAAQARRSTLQLEAAPSRSATPSWHRISCSAQVRCTCGVHAVHTRCTCGVRAVHMRCTCGANQQ